MALGTGLVSAQTQVKNTLAKPMSITQTWNSPNGLSREDAVYAFLQSKILQPKSKGKVSANDTKAHFKIISQKSDASTNTTIVKTKQQVNGVSVYGAEQTIALDNSNNVKAYFGTIANEASLEIVNTDAAISSDEAVDKVKGSIEEKIGKVEDYDGIKSELIIDPNDNNSLVYYVKASTTMPAPGYWHYFVDAKTGNIIKSFNTIHDTAFDFSDKNPVPAAGPAAQTSVKKMPPITEPAAARGMDIFGNLQSLQAVKDPADGTYYLYDGTRGKGMHTFDAIRLGETPFILLSALFGFTGYEVTSMKNFFYDPAAVSAHVNAGKVYDYYKKTFQRNSLDGNGMQLVSTVHIGDKWNNAAWNGKQMLYGDGDGNQMISLSGGLDVIGHEMTHGVIEKTANLVYENEPGALNESLADIMGSFIENKSGDDLWLMGEDIWTPNKPGDGLRSLSDPASIRLGGYTEDGRYPDHYDKRYLGTLDHGGVHINSSINNKAAYLITNGGTHYGVTVTGIGKDKAQKIFYRTITTYLNASSDFSQMRQAAIQAARDLYPDIKGVSSAEVKAVEAAYTAVGVQ
ncbi:M4 family metallopeptidase [Metabacillus sp. GX 13764]|nr:M4 family metallopeptidase [Metabacillus kandeliae]MCD7033672.1 M4 family metallopeptidase [Metabacillus kandeliae]